MTNEIKSLNTLWSLFLEKIPQQLSIRTKSGHKHFHMLVWLCQLKHGPINDPPKHIDLQQWDGWEASCVEKSSELVTATGLTSLLPAESVLLVADLLPNTESKSTLRPVELGGWSAGGAEKPVLKKIKNTTDWFTYTCLRNYREQKCQNSG